MADNTIQSGNANIAADDVTTLNGGASSGVLVQRIKNTWGADGTATDVSAANPMPTVQTGALPAGTNKIGSVGRTIDGARTAFAATFTSSTAAAADTIIATLTTQKGATQATNQTSVAVTSGKVLRITSILLGLRTTTAALPYGVLTLRINHSGAAVIGSPTFYQVPVSGNAAVIGNTGVTPASIEDGLELSGTMQFALSFSNNVATNVTTATVLGYEYTA